MKGATTTGFNFEVDEEVVQDYEFIELLGGVDEDPLKITKVFTELLGEEQTKKLKDHVRNKKGRVPIQALMNELKEILSVKPLKN